MSRGSASLQRHDPVQEFSRDPRKSEQAERAPPLSETGRDVHSEAARSDDQAGHDDHVGHGLDHGQQARRRGTECLHGHRCSLEREGALELCSHPFDRTRRPVRRDDDRAHGEGCELHRRQVPRGPGRGRRVGGVPQDLREEVSDGRHGGPRCASADGRSLGEFVTRDDSERSPLLHLVGSLMDRRHPLHSRRRPQLAKDRREGRKPPRTPLDSRWSNMYRTGPRGYSDWRWRCPLRLLASQS